MAFLYFFPLPQGQGSLRLGVLMGPDSIARQLSQGALVASTTPPRRSTRAGRAPITFCIRRLSARVDALEGANSFVTDPVAAFAAAQSKLTKALSSVPDHTRALLYLGLVHIWTKRATEGIAECEHALDLDRNLAEAHSAIGLGKIFVGRAEETEAHIAEALRLSPRDTVAYLWMTNVGIAKNQVASWEQAVGWLRRAVEANGNFPTPYFLLAVALAQLGRTGRGALRSQGWPRAQPGLHDLPRPRRVDVDDRRPDVSGPARTLS